MKHGIDDKYSKEYGSTPFIVGRPIFTVTLGICSFFFNRKKKRTKKNALEIIPARKASTRTRYFDFPRLLLILQILRFLLIK